MPVEQRGAREYHHHNHISLYNRRSGLCVWLGIRQQRGTLDWQPYHRRTTDIRGYQGATDISKTIVQDRAP